MENLNLFHEIAANPNDYIKEFKKKSRKKVIGSFCSYIPEEIITAGDAIAFRIFGSSNNISLADAHLQSYSCSLVRGALEDALSGKIDFLDGTVFPHTCDSIQRLSDIWRINVKFGFHADIVLPVKLNTKSAEEYMIKVFNKFKCEMEEKLDAKITDEKLKETIVLYNQIRKLLKKIYDLRIKKPSLISGSDIHAIFRASMVMERKYFLERLSNLVEAIEGKGSEEKQNKKRIVLSGGICNMPNIYKIIEDAGGMVVSDDICTGLRYCDGYIDIDSNNPIDSIAKRYFERIVCPAKHSGLFARGERLIKVVKENNAKGVIFLFLKFCDPHLFDYPYIKNMLEKETIASMLFETEDNMLSDGQFNTRCEAFLEML